MAFRKRTFRPKFKVASARAVARKANKRHTWVECFNVHCEPQALDCDTPEEPPPIGETECCRTNFQVVLVDNALIQGQAAGVPGFSDACTVVALQGYITLLPTIVYSSPSDPIADFGAITSTGIIGTMGLRKSDVTAANTLGDEYFLMDTEDYTESKMRRTWEHHQWPRGADYAIRGSITGGVYGCAICSNVSKVVGTNSTITDGTGTIIGDKAISTTCTTTTCEHTADGVAQDYRVGGIPPSPWKWSLNSRKRFALREDEQLALHLSLSAFNAYGTLPLAPVGFSWMGRCKALLEF